MLRWQPRFKIGKESVLPITEVDKVFFKIGVLRSIELSKVLHQIRGQVSESELALIVMRSVTPVLLNVHLVGIKPIQSNSARVVGFDKLLKKRKRARTEIVHFRSLVTDNHQDP